jgi:GNAT superfamily N-acetyltransferase
MQRIRLTHINQQFFEEAWALYEISFPLEERRTLDTQAKIMDHKNYCFEVIVEEGGFIGLLCWWGFETLRYFEHFATLPEHRGKGYGADILNTFKELDDRKVLLEVEMPDDEIKTRRIAFYQRNGFKLYEHPYHQPALRAGSDGIDLYIMSWPGLLSQSDIEHFIRECHPVIYGE